MSVGPDSLNLTVSNPKVPFLNSELNSEGKVSFVLSKELDLEESKSLASPQFRPHETLFNHIHEESVSKRGRVCPYPE